MTKRQYIYLCMESLNFWIVCVIFKFILQPPSPAVIKKFRATVRPDAGQMRIFYGKAGDPHRQWAENMTHGINTQPSDSSGAIVNPPYKTLFQQRLVDRKERIYSSHQRAPLGVSHDQSTGLPKGLNRDTFTFGVPTELGNFCFL